MENQIGRSELLEEEAHPAKIKSISTVILTFVETCRIGPPLRKIDASLKKAFCDYEINIVDEGSTHNPHDVISTKYLSE